MGWKDNKINVVLPHYNVVNVIENEIRKSKIDISNNVENHRFGSGEGKYYCTYVGARDTEGIRHTCELYFHVYGKPKTNEVFSHHCGDYPNTQKKILDLLKEIEKG